MVKQLARALPLTHFHEALVSVMVEGQSITTTIHHLLLVALWAIGCSVVSLKTFRWE